MNIIIKRFLAFFLSFAIIFSSVSSANAATSVGGWTALDTITAGANNTINATKTAGGKVLKSAITIAPQAGKVGKYLLRGAGVGALALAVSQLTGDSVDWVLDPANNAVKYTNKGVAGNYIIGCPTVQCSVTNYSFRAPVSPTAEKDVCAMLAASAGRSGTIQVIAGQCVVGGSYSVGYISPATFPAEDKPAYLPISTVAAKVIANAGAGHAPSQEAVKATALEGFAAGEYDAALDASAVPDTGVQNPPDTENPPNDKPVPFDPSSIIAAIKSVMSAITNMAGILGAKFDALMIELGLQNAETNRVINDSVDRVIAEDDARAAQTKLDDDARALEAIEADKIAAAKVKEDADAKAQADKEFQDWVKEDAPPPDEDTALDIPSSDISPVSTDINFGGSCPANFEVNSSIFGNPINITLFDTSKFCSFLSTFVKFPVYAASSLFALYILGGRKDV